MISNSNAVLKLVSVALVAYCGAHAAWAETPPAQLDTRPETTTAGDLSDRSDTELTALTAQWSTLNPSERRQLLAEVRRRMAVNHNASRPAHIRVQRRYGRVVRKSDGSVVVQTRVVEMRPRVAEGGVADAETHARVTFGFGFERRSRQEPRLPQTPTQASQPAPAVTVSQERQAP